MIFRESLQLECFLVRLILVELVKFETLVLNGFLGFYNLWKFQLFKVNFLFLGRLRFKLEFIFLIVFFVYRVCVLNDFFIFKGIFLLIKVYNLYKMVSVVRLSWYYFSLEEYIVLLSLCGIVYIYMIFFGFFGIEYSFIFFLDFQGFGLGIIKSSGQGRLVG